MTRKSQNFYEHEIKKNHNFVGTRYSLTFKCVDTKFHNSMYLVGDSNAQKLNFGASLGTFGPNMPGEKVFIPTINKIIPEDCIAYSNVTILCGINSIKSNDVKSPDDIRKIYNELKYKIEKIQYLNKKCKINICPILL